VVAGQSWHWVDPVAGAAKAARVLRPGGRLALFWHVFQPPAEVSDASAEAYRLVMPDSPFNPRSRPPGSALDAYQPILTRAADGVRAAGGFGEPEQWSYAAERVYARDEYLDFMPTAGNLAQLQPDKLAHVLDGTAAAIDALGGTLTMTIYTAAVTALRLPLVR
jgi:SAM-dependent methyltransferase